MIFLKLCLAQDYYFSSSQDLRTTNLQNDKVFNNIYDWKNNFDNNIIIPDAYVFNLYYFMYLHKYL